MKMNNQSVKNYQTDETIKRMYEKAFSITSSNIKITKLSGGMKNAVYLIENDNRKIVLKIGPRNEEMMISADKNVMWWESQMLKLMETIDVPTPKLLHFDSNNEICQSPCIFMSYILDENYSKSKENLTEKKVSDIEYQLGILSSKICSIKSDKFFLPSHPNMIFEDNYEFVKYLFDLLLLDAKKNNVDLGTDGSERIDHIIKQNERSLKNIDNLCLVHTDIWDGNIIINDGKVSGVVDLADMYFCDELMTFYFHTIDGKTSKNFLEGFGKTNLSTDEKIRIEIYRMYVILKMIVDCKIKQYGKFDWMYENLNLRIKTLQKTIKL